MKKYKITRWNLAKEGGWELYKNMTDKFSEKIDVIVRNEELSIQEVSVNISSILDKVRYAAFGKVTLRNKIENRLDNIPISLAEEEEENKAENLHNDQIKKTEKEIEEIKKSKFGKVGQIWNMRKKVIGGKRNYMHANAIINPTTGKLMVPNEQSKTSDN